MTSAEGTASADEKQIEGVAAAALVAAGVGAFALGLMTTLNEAWSWLNETLRLNDSVGPLSGKTIVAAIAYFGALIILGLVWRERQLSLRPILWTAVVLLVLGLIGTFPTFFEAFAD